MRYSRFTDAQIVAAPQTYAAGPVVQEVCRRHRTCSKPRHHWEHHSGDRTSTEPRA